MRTLLFVLAALALGVPAQAYECVPSNASPELCDGRLCLFTNGEAQRDYWDDDGCQPDCLFRLWGYYETNGIPGLQRQDEVEDNTCGTIQGDARFY